jgi:hypothetical protein
METIFWNNFFKFENIKIFVDKLKTLILLENFLVEQFIAVKFFEVKFFRSKIFGSLGLVARVHQGNLLINMTDKNLDQVLLILTIFLF